MTFGESLVGAYTARNSVRLFLAEALLAADLSMYIPYPFTLPGLLLSTYVQLVAAASNKHPMLATASSPSARLPIYPCYCQNFTDGPYLHASYIPIVPILFTSHTAAAATPR